MGIRRFFTRREADDSAAESTVEPADELVDAPVVDAPDAKDHEPSAAAPPPLFGPSGAEVAIAAASTHPTTWAPLAPVDGPTADSPAAEAGAEGVEKAAESPDPAPDAVTAASPDAFQDLFLEPSVAAEEGPRVEVRTDPRPRTLVPATATAAPARPTDASHLDRVAPVVIGERSSFGSKDWWESGWWPMESSGGDVRADFATHGALAVAGVSLRGDKHRYAGQLCEDAFHFRAASTTTGPYVCLAVCDGVGSAERSRTGANWLSAQVTERLAAAVAEVEDDLTHEDIRAAVMQAIDDVHQRAARAHYSLTDLRTTLTFAVIPASSLATTSMIVGQVGDSPAFVGDEDGDGDGWLPVLTNDATADGTAGGASEAILTNVTQDALAAQAEDLRITSTSLVPGGRLLVCSDGVGNYIRSGTTLLDLGRHLGVALRRPVPPLDFIRHASFDLRSADDDRTMVVVWRMPQDPNAA
jgi:serine/threonine protein phosphatase PrpC